MKIKNKRKNNKGITLVSLVITIIIMLIIAGVSMKLIFTEDGVIDSAEDASKKPEKVQTIQLARKEILKLGVENSREANFEEAMNIIKKYDKNQTIKKYGEDDAYITTNKGNKILVSEIWKGEKELDPNPGVLEQYGNTLVVSSIEDFIALAYDVNSGRNNYAGKTIVLGLDIDFEGNSYAEMDATYSKSADGFGYIKDPNSHTTLRELLTSGEGFIPIGIQGGEGTFKGNFEGNGHYIANIYEEAEAYGGLFGCIDSDVHITNLEIRSGTIIAKNQAGAVVGIESNPSYIQIENCINRATIIGKNLGEGHVGGIVGQLKGGIIKNCENYGTISGYRFAGGIIGKTDNPIQIANCYNYGEIESKANSAGGIAGGGQINIYNSFNEGNIIGYSSAGGIAGGIENARVENCFNTGSITSKEGTSGIGATSSATFSYCYNFGNVKSTSNNWNISTGISLYSTCSNCYNIGVIEGNNECFEITGGSTSNCYYYNRNNGTNVTANGVTTMNQNQINQIQNKENFINLLNSYVDTNNSNQSNIRLNRWQYVDGQISFES